MDHIQDFLPSLMLHIRIYCQQLHEDVSHFFMTIGVDAKAQKLSVSMTKRKEGVRMLEFLPGTREVKQ